MDPAERDVIRAKIEALRLRAATMPKASVQPRRTRRAAPRTRAPRERKAAGPSLGKASADERAAFEAWMRRQRSSGQP